MLHLYEFVWILFIDATDRSKISSDQKRFFITLSLYPLSFFANTPFKKKFLTLTPFIPSVNSISTLVLLQILTSQFNQYLLFTLNLYGFRIEKNKAHVEITGNRSTFEFPIRVNLSGPTLYCT